MLLGGVLDAAVVQIPVELRLVDGIHRAQAHGNGRELPEVRHEARVRVGRQRHRLAVHHVAVLLTEPVELGLGQPTLEERPGVDAGGSMALDVDLVATAFVVTATEEVVEADLKQGGGRCI